VNIKIIKFDVMYQEKTKKFILNILEKEFNYFMNRPDLNNIAKEYQKGKSNFFIAVDEMNDVIGSIAIVNYGENRGYLKRLYVKKENRGTGLARKLLENLIIYAQNNKYKVIYLGTVKLLEAANKFYNKNGFKKIDKLPEDFPLYDDTEFFKLEIGGNS